MILNHHPQIRPAIKPGGVLGIVELGPALDSHDTTTWRTISFRSSSEDRPYLQTMERPSNKGSHNPILRGLIYDHHGCWINDVANYTSNGMILQVCALIIPFFTNGYLFPKGVKQPRFGSLVARALTHAVPIGISSLCTKYTSFYGVAEHTRQRTQILNIWSSSRAFLLLLLLLNRSSRLRSTSNTNVITGLDMFQVCTEAIDCVALWTRTSSQVWTCLKYVPKQSIA